MLSVPATPEGVAATHYSATPRRLRRSRDWVIEPRHRDVIWLTGNIGNKTVTD